VPLAAAGSVVTFTVSASGSHFDLTELAVRAIGDQKAGSSEGDHRYYRFRFRQFQPCRPLRH
jgi:hypothetical protein